MTNTTEDTAGIGQMFQHMPERNGIEGMLQELIGIKVTGNQVQPPDFGKNEVHDIRRKLDAMPLPSIFVEGPQKLALGAPHVQDPSLFDVLLYETYFLLFLSPGARPLQLATLELLDHPLRISEVSRRIVIGNFRLGQRWLRPAKAAASASEDVPESIASVANAVKRFTKVFHVGGGTDQTLPAHCISGLSVEVSWSLMSSNRLKSFVIARDI